MMISQAYKERARAIHSPTPFYPPTIYFDLDGTLANLYNYPDWLDRLLESSVTPYLECLPIGNPEELKPLLNRLKRRGVRLGVISWGAKGGTTEYTRAVKRAKIEWLNRYYPDCFEEIHVVKYGTPKKSVAKNKHSILIDDNQQCRQQWGHKTVDATDFQNILKSLSSLLLTLEPNRRNIFTA